jgi:hypothetical protein
MAIMHHGRYLRGAEEHASSGSADIIKKARLILTKL